MVGSEMCILFLKTAEHITTEEASRILNSNFLLLWLRCGLEKFVFGVSFERFIGWHCLFLFGGVCFFR